MVFSKHVKVRREKFGSVIFETLREKVYVTNEAGSDILQLIAEEQERESIVKNLCDIYAGDSRRINKEVTAFINQLREKELISQ